MVRDVAGILLTGGESRRLGADKAQLRLGHETLAQRSARLLASVVSRSVEVGPGRSGLPSVWETPRRSGPLRALVAGAEAIDASAYLLLAVDLPAMTVGLLDLLVRHPSSSSVVPRVAGRSQLVCARWSGAAVAQARALITRGASSLRELEATVPVVHLAEDRWCSVASAAAFADVDEPADLERLGRAGAT